MCKAQFLQESRNPYFMWQNNFVDLDLASPTEELTPETFVASDVRDSPVKPADLRREDA